MRARSSSSTRWPAITAGGAPAAASILVMTPVSAMRGVTAPAPQAATALPRGTHGDPGAGPALPRRAVTASARGLDHEQVTAVDLDRVTAGHRGDAPVHPLDPVPPQRPR